MANQSVISAVISEYSIRNPPPQDYPIYYTDNGGILYEGRVRGHNITFEGEDAVVTLADYFNHPYLSLIQSSLAREYQSGNTNVLEKLRDFENNEATSIPGALQLYRLNHPNGIPRRPPARGGKSKRRKSTRRKSRRRKTRR
jgi:hypothetical protein